MFDFDVTIHPAATHLYLEAAQVHGEEYVNRILVNGQLVMLLPQSPSDNCNVYDSLVEVGIASFLHMGMNQLRIEAGLAGSNYDDIWLRNIEIQADTLWQCAFHGTIVDADSETAIDGALVNAIRAGEVVASSVTNRVGYYAIAGLIPGDYILLVQEAGYQTAATDLYRHTGTPIEVDFALPPCDPGPKPELMVSPQDITYTVLEGGALALTAMAHNLGSEAHNVRVRFLVENVSAGLGEPVSVGEDQVLPEVLQCDARPVTVIWAPLSGFDRFHVILDPENSIVELSELNNAAYRDLGVIGRLPPEIVRVAPEWDGIDDDRVVGRFISGVAGQSNVFTVEVGDPDNDVTRVEFQFGDEPLVVDGDPSDGWSGEMDLGDLPVGDIPLIVTAYDAAGLSSEPRVLAIRMDAWPWLVSGQFEIAPDKFPIGFEVEPGYFHVCVKLVSTTGPGNIFQFVHQIGEDLILIGRLRSEIDGNVYLDVGIPQGEHLGPKVGGKVIVEEVLLGQTISEFECDITAQFDPQWNLEGFSVETDLDVTIASWEVEYRIPLPPAPWIEAIVAIGADFFAHLGFEMAWSQNIEVFEGTFSPGVGAQINGTVGLSILFGFAEIEAVISPRLTMMINVTYRDPGGLQTGLGGEFEVRYRIGGCIAWVICCDDIVSGAWGPWEFELEGYEPERRQDFNVNVPDLLAYPTLCSGPENRLGLIWVRDIDPDTTRVDPEVYFAWADSAGTWSAPMPVTGGGASDGWFQINPSLAFRPTGEAVAVWTQNSYTETEALREEPTLSEVFDHQDIWWSQWDGGQWSAPAPIHADPPEALRADGLPAVDFSPTGSQGLVLWTRSMGDSALAQGAGEIFYAVCDGQAWGAAQRLTENTAGECSPEVSYGPDGSALAVWVQQSATGAQNLVLGSLWDGASWAPPVVLSPAGQSVRSPSVTRTPAGDGLATWTGREIDPVDSTAVYRVYATRWDHGRRGWDTPEVVHSDSLLIEATLAHADQRGIAAITWRGHDGYDGDLFVSLRDMDDGASHWTLADQMTDDDLTDWMITSTVDEQNNLHFVDLKTDLADTTGSANRGAFFDGLALMSRGIGGDLRIEDDLNYGFRPLSADLKVVAVAVSDTLPAEGQVVTLEARIANIGDVRTIPTVLLFTDGHPDSGGAAIGDPVPLAAMHPDDSTWVATTWTAGAGGHDLWVWVDSGDLVEEQTESNNRGSVSAAALPDLVASAVFAVGDNPAPGDSVTIHAIVQNLGGTEASDVVVRLLVQPVGAPVPDTLGTPIVPDLVPGQADTVSAGWVAPAGISSLTVVADPDDAITEWLEDNNTTSVHLKVLADIAIGSESLAMIVGPDSTHTISATVTNDGGLGAASVPVHFYRGDPMAQGALLGEVTVPGIEAFGEEQVQLIVPFQVGVVNLHAIADEPDSIAERDENNNWAQEQFLFTLLPDLAIATEDILVHGYEGPELPFTIRASVHNRGLADVVAPRVQFFDGHPDSGGVFIGGRIVPSILRDSTAVLEMEWAVADSADHKLYVWVDREQIISELDEGNNLAGRGLWQASAVGERDLRGFTGLLPASPNPFGVSTLIRCSLGRPLEVDLRIFDVGGRLVRTLLKGPAAAGVHHFLWDGRDERRHAVGTGIYFVRLQAEQHAFERKIALIR